MNLTYNGTLIGPEFNVKEKGAEDDDINVLRTKDRKLSDIAPILKPSIIPGITTAMRNHCAEAVKGGIRSFAYGPTFCLNKNDGFQAPGDNNDEDSPRLQKLIPVAYQPKTVVESDGGERGRERGSARR